MKLGAIGLAVGVAALLVAALSFTIRGTNDGTVTTSTLPQPALAPEATVTETIATPTVAPAAPAVTQTVAPAAAPVAPPKPASRPATHRAAPSHRAAGCSDTSDPTGDDSSCGSGDDNGPDDQAGDGKGGD
jgi:hypothetical protein